MLISATDIIKQSFELYRNNWKIFIQYALLLLIPGTLIGASGASLGYFILATDFIISFLAWGILIVLFSILSFWFSLALIRVINKRYQNLPTKNLKEELLDSKNLILPAILASILSGLAVMGGIVLFIIPGIIFAVWFMFSMYEVALDNKKTIEALQHSKDLVSGRWFAVAWRIIAPAVLFGIIIIIIQWILVIPLNLLGNQMSGTAAMIWGGIYAILTTLISTIAAPLTTTAPTILYHNLKENPVITEKSQLEPPKA